MIPHNFGFVQPAEVDMRLMSIFVEFYTTVLGFVNFRLYHSLNLSYPPQLSTVTEAGEADMEDRVAALNQSLQRTVVEEDDDNMEGDLGEYDIADEIVKNGDKAGITTEEVDQDQQWPDFNVKR